MGEHFGCGFARMAVRQSFFKPNGKVEYDQELRWKNYLSQFEGPHYDKFVVEEKKHFEKRSKVLSLHFKKWKTKEKRQYIEHFSKQNWDSLPEIEKKQHQRVNCQGCAVHHYAFQSLFPSWGRNNSLPLQDVINKTQDHVLKPSTAANVKPTLKAIKQAVNKIYNDINGPFKELFGMSFANAQTKMPELSLQEKKSQSQLRKERREKLRNEKKQMEEHWSKRDCDTMLATRQTYKQRQEQRLALFFESPEEAENRYTKRKDLEDHGLRKKKRHSPRPEDLQFDKDGLLQEVNAMQDGDRVSIIFHSIHVLSGGQASRITNE